VFVALGIQHAMLMRHILSVVCPAVQYFSTLSHKRHGFLKNVFEHEMCVSIFYTTFILKISHCKRIERDVIKMCVGLHVKYPLFLSGCKET